MLVVKISFEDGVSLNSMSVIESIREQDEELADKIKITKEYIKIPELLAILSKFGYEEDDIDLLIEVDAEVCDTINEGLMS